MAAAQLTSGAAARPKLHTALIGTYCDMRRASVTWDARPRSESAPLSRTGRARASAKA